MKRWILIILIGLGFLIQTQTSFSQEDGLISIVETQHFHVSAYEGCDIAGVLRKLNFDYSSRLDSYYNSQASGQVGILSKTLDAIFAEASDVLDINLFSYKGGIKIFANQRVMRRALKKYLSGRIQDPSYYIQDSNTIYISYEDLTLGILGHEIAHAIISNYFVVSPPPKVHEVLAGYVEYSLRKSSGSLSIK